MKLHRHSSSRQPKKEENEPIKKEKKLNDVEYRTLDTTLITWHVKLLLPQCGNFLRPRTLVCTGTYLNVGVEKWYVRTTLPNNRFQNAPQEHATGAAEATTGRELGRASEVRHVQQTTHPDVDLISCKLCFDPKPDTKSTFIRTSESQPLASWYIWYVYCHY